MHLRAFLCCTVLWYTMRWKILKLVYLVFVMSKIFIHGSVFRDLECSKTGAKQGCQATGCPDKGENFFYWAFVIRQPCTCIHVVWFDYETHRNCAPVCRSCHCHWKGTSTHSHQVSSFILMSSPSLSLLLGQARTKRYTYPADSLFAVLNNRLLWWNCPLTYRLLGLQDYLFAKVNTSLHTISCYILLG